MNRPENALQHFDFHTHCPDTPPGRGIVCLPKNTILHDGSIWVPQKGGFYAAGVHPWWTADADFDLMTYCRGLKALLQHSEVVQVGECGIDRVRGGALELQLSVMTKMVEISETARRPMTIHCVKAFDLLLKIHKDLKPQQKWTIHGFRGNAILAQQLLDRGMDLSFGTHFNPEAWDATPPDRRHRESDAE